MRQGLKHQVGRRGVRLLAGGVIVGGMVGSMGVAAAAEQQADQTIGADTSTVWLPPEVAVATGDTVTWSWNTSVAHNVAAGAGPPEDPAWAGFQSDFGTAVTTSYTFTQPGSYGFVCQVHSGMTGTVTVTGDPTDPPDPTPTPTPTPTPPAATPTPAPTVGPSGTPPGGATPAPGGGAADTTAPALTGLSLRGIRHGAKVSFRLSETATLVARVRRQGSRKVLRTFRLQARAGKRTITLRSGKFQRGRMLRIELQARDARGNASAVQRSSVRVQRG